MSLELLVRAIKSRTPISFEYNKAGKTPGLRIGNAHAAFIMRRKDGTESTKVDIVQTAGVSDTDPPVFPEWRMFDLTEISNIVLREQEAPFTIDPGYIAETHRYEFAIAHRLADADVGVVKIKELMGHASILTTMRYIHATDQGKRGAITVLSEYRQQHCRKFVTNEKRQILQPATIR